MSINYHKEAIKILRDTHTEQQMRELLMKIAELRPSAIAHAAGVRIVHAGWSKGAVNQRVELANWALLDEFLKQMKPVQAIKELRAETGLSLKSAKDAIDLRKAYLINKGEMQKSLK